MVNCVKAALFAAVVGAGLSVAGGAQAANVSVCLGSAVENVALNSLVSGIENGIVILNASGSPVYKANNYYGNGAGGYWTSALPQTISLAAGCYTVFFMTKPTAPAPGVGWTCGQPTAFPGNGFTVLSGALGNITTSFVLLPTLPQSGSNSDAACPQGW